MIIEAFTAFFLLVGAVLIFIAALGVARFPDLFTRMHAASKATSLGIGFMVAAVAIWLPSAGVITKAAAIILFFFLTTPIAAHMLSRAAYMLKVPLWPETRIDELKDRYKEDRSQLASTPASDRNHHQ